MLPPAKTEDRLASPPWWPFWLAFAAALLLRFLWLDVRPLHHDEGVNGWFLYRLLQGYRWEYDPEKFHGPFLYFFSAPFPALLGMSEIILRLPVAAASSAMIPLLLPLRRRLGRAGVTSAAWLLAVSPSLVSYGRDLIHETFLVVLTLALVAAGVRWLEEQRDVFLLLAVLALSLLFTVKETAALTVGSLAAGALAAWLAAGRSSFLKRGISWKIWGLLVLVAAIPYVLLYTSFFTNPAGLVDSFRAYLPWTEKGFEGTGHEKPWPYFLKLLATFEPVALACGVLGSAAALWRRNPFGILCGVWWLTQLVAYSAIPYKTPWLALNVVLPLALSSGFLVAEMWQRPLPGPLRTALSAAALLLLAWTASKAVDVSFLRYDDERLGLVYVQTSREQRDFLKLVEEDAARSRKGKALPIRFYTGNRWPLPWYLRDYTNVLYLEEVPEKPEGDVLICDPGKEQKLRQRLKGKYLRREYTLRERVKLVVYVSRQARK